MEIVGIEIPVLDLEKGIKFYEDVFGWKIDRETFPGQGVVSLNDCVTVGIFQTTKLRPKGLNVGFAVKDITTTLNKIVEGEGKIIKDKFKFEGQVGYVAVFQDCFGNEMSLFSEN
jgi:predicted enzyme related to lactoylglutathione lyase